MLLKATKSAEGAASLKTISSNYAVALSSEFRTAFGLGGKQARVLKDFAEDFDSIGTIRV